MEEFLVNVSADTDRFVKAIKHLVNEFVLLSKYVVERMRDISEDSFVEYCGIARSDIKKIKFENNDAVAILYNGRKIQLDLKNRMA